MENNEVEWGFLCLLRFRDGRTEFPTRKRTSRNKLKANWAKNLARHASKFLSPSLVVSPPPTRAHTQFIHSIIELRHLNGVIIADTEAHSSPLAYAQEFLHLRYFHFSEFASAAVSS